MNARRNCLAILALACAAPLRAAQRADAPSPARPSFVIAIADDVSWDDFGAYGHPRIQTPSVDRLAREGMRFDRAFVTTSSCSPSRASILTGRYPHATGAPELHQPLPAEQVTLFEVLGKAGYYTAAAGKWHLGDATKREVDRIYGGGASGCEKWLVALRERPKDRPFFLWLAAFDAHRDYAESAIPSPHRPSDAIVPPYLPDGEATRRDFALYYDEVARLDGYLGEVIEELERQDAARDTFVLFLADNGRPFPRCKTTLYDSGIRTPFVVRWPAVVKAGSTSSSIVSAVDIAPTVAELAGVGAVATFQGRSFVPILKDPRATVREHAFAERNWHDYTAHERAVRSARFAYVWNAYPELPQTPPADAVRSPTFAALRALRDAGKLSPAQMACFKAPRPAEELYDLDKDPHALENVAADPAYAGALAELRAALAGWKESTQVTIPARRRPDEFDRERGTRLERGASE
jgi:arylsulfatase A-like enzyme